MAAMTLLFMVIGEACFILAAFNVPTGARVSVGWLGVAFVAATLIPGLVK